MRERRRGRKPAGMNQEILLLFLSYQEIKVGNMATGIIAREERGGLQSGG